MVAPKTAAKARLTSGMTCAPHPSPAAGGSDRPRTAAGEARAQGGRPVRVEHVDCRERGQKLVDVGLVGNLNRLVGVGKGKAVQAEHHGRHHSRVLGDAVRLDNHVERFLTRLQVELNPARVALLDGVLMVAHYAPGQSTIG